MIEFSAHLECLIENSKVANSAASVQQPQATDGGLWSRTCQPWSGVGAASTAGLYAKVAQLCSYFIPFTFSATLIQPSKVTRAWGQAWRAV